MVSGEIDEGVARFLRARDCDVNLASTYSNLAWARGLQGRVDEGFAAGLCTTTIPGNG